MLQVSPVRAFSDNYIWLIRAPADPAAANAPTPADPAAPQVAGAPVVDDKGVVHYTDKIPPEALKAAEQAMADIKSGVPEVSAPIYSHLVYDVVPGETVTVDAECTKVSGRRVGFHVKAHDGIVHQVAFAPDGSVLATSSDDGNCSSHRR